MIGAIIGDVVGSVFEKHNLKSKCFEPFFQPNARITDDTVCTVAIADALLYGKKPTPTLQSWCRKYEHIGGWGQRFAMWIADDDPQPYGSFGNGAAMRISSVGFLAPSEIDAIKWADYFTVVTHNHDEAVKAARSVALAIFFAKQKRSVEFIRENLVSRFGYDLHQTVDEIRPTYKHTETSAGSVPQAIVCALESKNYEDAIRNAISIGGDSDTIACICGGIAEALHGIPQEIKDAGISYLPEDMAKVIEALYSVK